MRRFRSRYRNLPYVFGTVPSVSMQRSRFDLSHGCKTTMSVGRLYPVEVVEVLPGDTFKFHTSQVCRLSTAFLKPVMDNAYMDVYYFFVPHRLAYEKFQNVFGENTESAWANTEEYAIPSFGTQQTVTSKTVADYLGLPLGQVPGDISLLPFREFALIYDQWFRNENTVPPMHVQKGERASSEQLNSAEWSPNNYTGLPPKVGKRKDYFTSALPSPQKGAPVSVSISQGMLPVTARQENIPVNLLVGDNYNALRYTIDGLAENVWTRAGFSNFGRTIPIPDRTNARLGELTAHSGGSDDASVGISAVPVNLWANASYLTPTNVNDLRMAFQLQKMLEKDARYGTRYREYLLGHFGVSNPDARMQIPEFLGGSRMPIRVQQVAQTNTQNETAEQTIESPLASLGAFSQSNGKSRFTKSFTEHGYVFVCACIRTLHTYQQGIDKHWSRLSRNDFYDPLFANLGEQPIYRSEIYAKGEASFDANVFGYQEAWADYRYKPSKVTGQMRSEATDSFDVWHFADEYANAPALSEEFTNETSTFFDRTVAAPSTQVDNFLVDFWFDCLAYRVMPKYSVPGLIDHH